MTTQYHRVVSGRRSWFLGTVLVLAACSTPIAADRQDRSPTQPTESTPPSPAPSASEVELTPLAVRPRHSIPAAEEGLPSLSATKVTDGNYPAGLAVAPDGRIFFTELYGGVIRVIDERGAVSEWYDVNEHFDIEWTEFYHGGLSAIAIDPEFRTNHYVFAVTQVPSRDTGLPVKSLILRFTERNGVGTRPKVLLTVPAQKITNIYSLVFSSSGTVFVPSGAYLRPGAADQPGDLAGEVLHITRDGDPVPGGPLGPKAPMTWAYGLRMPFDVAIEPETGYLVGGENGEKGHDEIDLIAPGRYYGWAEHEGIVEAASEMTQPLVDLGPGHWAPVGMIRYDGARYPKLRGLYLVCMNHQPGVYAMRIDPGPPARLMSFTKVAATCSIDIAASRDGRIFIADAYAIYELT